MRSGRIAFCAVILLGVLAVVGFPRVGAPAAAEKEHAGVADASDPSKVRDCLITPIKLIDVPAQEPGVLVEIKVRENQQVKKGELVAQIDDRQPAAARSVAEYKLVAAEKEKENRISVDYARAKNLVAKAAYDKGTEANDRVPGTTPAIELLKLKLEVVASKLETDHAEYQLEIAATTVDVRKAELEQSRLDVERRKILAPWEGEVVKRYKEDGEWVKPGDPVIQLLQIDHLRVEAFLDGTQLSRFDVTGRSVTVLVTLKDGRQATFEGQITMVSPLTEAGSRFLVKADVVNRQEGARWLLHPGMNAEMTIHLKK